MWRWGPIEANGFIVGTEAAYGFFPTLWEETKREHTLMSALFPCDHLPLLPMVEPDCNNLYSESHGAQRRRLQSVSGGANLSPS